MTQAARRRDQARESSRAKANRLSRSMAMAGCALPLDSTIRPSGDSFAGLLASVPSFAGKLQQEQVMRLEVIRRDDLVNHLRVSGARCCGAFMVRAYFIGGQLCEHEPPPPVLKPREKNIFMPPRGVALGCIQLRS